MRLFHSDLNANDLLASIVHLDNTEIRYLVKEQSFCYYIHNRKES